MRVLHVMAHFSPLTETFIYDLVTELGGRVDAQTIVARERIHPAERPFPSFRLLTAYGRPALRAHVDRVLHRFAVDRAGDASWRGYRRSLRRIIDELRPDVLHAHFGSEGVLAAPVARDRGLPLLTSFYGVDASAALRAPHWRAAFQQLWAGANRVLALSGAMRAALVEAGCPEEKARVLATGKRLGDFPFAERTPPPCAFVTVGRLVAKKGHLDAIQAVERIARRTPIRLDIIGDGPLRESLAAYVESNRLEHVVRLRGALDHPTTVTAMSAADAFLLCSRTAPDGDQEGVPTVLMEAQALGLPCVSTLHAGIPEALPESNRWMLAPEGDVDAIVAIIERLRACSPGELARIARAGLEHVHANYDVTRQAARLAEVYADVAARAPVSAMVAR